jgi:hypothetical protein
MYIRVNRTARQLERITGPCAGGKEELGVDVNIPNYFKGHRINTHQQILLLQ